LFAVLENGREKFGSFLKFEVYLTGHSRLERPHRCVPFATVKTDHKSVKFSARLDRHVG